MMESHGNHRIYHRTKDERGLESDRKYDGGLKKKKLRFTNTFLEVIEDNRYSFSGFGVVWYLPGSKTGVGQGGWSRVKRSGRVGLEVGVPLQKVMSLLLC